MLGRQGIIHSDDVNKIVDGLSKIALEIENDEFVWKSDIEDIHMNIESRLYELIGDPAGKLHTGRSRNDQVATDTRLWTEAACGRAFNAVGALQSALVNLAEQHVNTIVPGYTHMQRGQPIVFAHHLLAYFEMFDRDATRFAQAAESTDTMPLGSGAIAGVTYPIDRKWVAEQLDFTEISRNSIDAVKELNLKRLMETGDEEIRTRIASYEMAFNMQTSAPELIDLKRESAATLKLYGAEPGKSSFANNCLLARRLVERGVRFVQLFHEAWDQHSRLVGDLKANCQDTDRAAAALIQDLKQRGMLDDTLVIWGGEFGRTPRINGNTGRDHWARAWSVVVGGGNIRGGKAVGATNSDGTLVETEPYTSQDIMTSVCKALGISLETTFTSRNGRPMRIANGGKVVKELFS